MSCAFGVDRVKLYDPLTYKPPIEEGTKVAYADAPEIKPFVGEKIQLVLKKIKDNRTDLTRIGVKKDSYGRETGSVDVEEGVVFLDTFTKRLINCFEVGGYEVIPLKQFETSSKSQKERAKAIIETEVRTFWTKFMPGIFTVDIVSDVIFEVTLNEPEMNREIWNESFRGKAKVQGVAATRSMYEKSINIAYSEAMRSFYNAISSEKLKRMLTK
jgi:hypothetical protein